MQSLSTKILTRLAFFATALSLQTSAWSAQPIKIVVPFTAGTGMDAIARAVAPKLSQQLGQPVMVQNTPGASGNIGANAVARAKADGQTILMGANTMLIASQTNKNVPFDPLKDFTGISLAATGTIMLVSNPKANLRTLNDLVTASKSKPDSVTFGSPGIGTPHHMAMELLKVRTGTSLMHVPYKGTAAYTNELLSGEIMVGFLPVHIAAAFVKAGKLNALAVGGNARHPDAPDVATFNELNVKDMDVDLWYAFFLPAQTPAPMVKQLNTEIAAIIRQPDVKQLFSGMGLEAVTSSADELNALARKDYQRWGEVIRQNGIEAE